MAPRQIALLSPGKVLYAAIAGNILVAATKFAAAALTGSSAMLSEAVHSVVDSGNSLLLLYGMHRAKALPDQDHPAGIRARNIFLEFRRSGPGVCFGSRVLAV